MSALPWLLVHGPAVWQAGLAVLVLGALLVAFLRPRIAARHAAKAARDRLGTPVATLVKPSAGMRVTLTGRIVVEGASCQRFEDGSDAAAASAAYAPQGTKGAWVTGLNVRAERLSLAVGEATVALEGPVEVVAGSREVRREKPLGELPRAVQDRVAAGFKLGAPHFRDHVTVLRSIAAGDVVRVSGVLRRESLAGEAAGYRAAAERWALIPDGDEAQAAAGATAQGGLRLAFEGAPRVRGPLAGWYARHAAAGMALSALLFGIGGEIAFAAASSALQELATGKPAAPDAGLGPTAIAAATPFRRMAAIEALADALDLRHDEDAVMIERRAALHQMHGDCAAAAKALARQGSLERGAELAEKCRDYAFAAKVFYVAGDFNAASHAWEGVEPNRVPPGKPGMPEADVRFGVRVHLLAGRIGLAARDARVLAKTLEAEVGSAEARPDDASRAALASCLADALDAKDGNQGALSSLRKRREKAIYPACAILLADQHQGKERLDLIHGITDFQSSAREVPMRWLDLLEQEADPSVPPAGPAPRVIQDPSLFVINPSLAIQGMLPAVEFTIATTTTTKGKPDDPRRLTRTRAATLAAAFAAATGDALGARMLAKIVENDAELGALGEAPDPVERSRAAALGAAVELAAGGVERAGELLAVAQKPYPEGFTLPLAALHHYRSERSPDKLVFFYSGWSITEEGVDQALLRAAEGDGPALAALLRRPASEPGAFLSLGAPLILKGREEVLQWIRLGYRMPGWFRSPSDQLVHWAVLASAAESLGDAKLAAALRERAGNFRRAILNRNIAVPLAVLERL
ncbi:MAG: hypothetical protein QM820_15855 [Minicystis sp.]